MRNECTSGQSVHRYVGRKAGKCVKCVILDCLLFLSEPYISSLFLIFNRLFSMISFSFIILHNAVMCKPLVVFSLTFLRNSLTS